MSNFAQDCPNLVDFAPSLVGIGRSPAGLSQNWPCVAEHAQNWSKSLQICPKSDQLPDKQWPNSAECGQTSVGIVPCWPNPTQHAQMWHNVRRNRATFGRNRPAAHRTLRSVPPRQNTAQCAVSSPAVSKKFSPRRTLQKDCDR